MEGGDRPRGNGSSSIRNPCRLLNRVLFVGCLVFLVVLDVDLYGFVF